MRTKGGLERDFVNSGDWKDKGVRGNPMSTLEVQMVDGQRKIIIHSFSGNERNKLFMNQAGANFKDASTGSGADSVADSRCFAYWDFNQDGAIDLAVINSNTPHVQILQNQIPSGQQTKNGFVVLRFVGGNDQPSPSSQWSNRNGVGSRVSVKAGDAELIREVRRGEGFSVQNSAKLIVGIGNRQQADSIMITWPSGQRQQVNNIESGRLVTFYENPQHSPDGTGFTTEHYQAAEPPNVARQPSRGIFNFPVPQSSEETKLRVLINMATWCESCRQELPAIEQLMATVDDPAVQFVGVPIDVEDSAEKLQNYVGQMQPPYSLLTDLGIMYRKGMSAYLRQQLGSDSLPNTVITDNFGNPLHAQFGLPTVSQIRRLLEVTR